MVQVSATTSRGAENPDQQASTDATPDRVDRGVVLNKWTKATAMFALRMLAFAVFVYALLKIIGAFWAGVLPMVLALIICTVLAPVATAMRRRKMPAGLAAAVTLLTFIALLAAIFMIIAPDVIAHSRLLYLQALEGIQRLQLWLQGPPFNLDPGDLNEAVNELAQWLSLIHI